MTIKKNNNRNSVTSQSINFFHSCNAGFALKCDALLPFGSSRNRCHWLIYDNFSFCLLLSKKQRMQERKNCLTFNSNWLCFFSLPRNLITSSFIQSYSRILCFSRWGKNCIAFNRVRWTKKCIKNQLRENKQEEEKKVNDEMKLLFFFSSSACKHFTDDDGKCVSERTKHRKKKHKLTKSSVIVHKTVSKEKLY